MRHAGMGVYEPRDAVESDPITERTERDPPPTLRNGQPDEEPATERVPFASRDV